MSLDLPNTAMQVDRMANEFGGRVSELKQHLSNGLRAVERFNLEAYVSKLEEHSNDVQYPAPVLTDVPGNRFKVSGLPKDFSVVSVDGSHIDVDRHMSAKCFLINIGIAVLNYGSKPYADLFSSPRLYATHDELVIRDSKTYREQSIEGTVLGAKRTVEEIRGLVNAVEGLSPNIPTLALLDGSLLMLGLVGNQYQEFVLRELVEDGFIEALDKLRNMASQRPIYVASYISFPGSTEVVNALKLAECSYNTSDANYRCGLSIEGRKPCDQCVGGIFDRDLYSEILGSGERSMMYTTSSRISGTYYAGNEVNFFYLNVGEEIGRVEVPSWIAEDTSSVEMVHSLILDQCRRGQGYPIGLMEAHEQAVLESSDRNYFLELVEDTLQSRGVTVQSSEKSRSKRLRWL